uniref:Uncharacterized protein n=1 Tax=Timema douglasi TaxID=61478 RepID=A0A7R8ZFL2_TIMDO|nr:unnamed protein product [Timema douglasi]
MTDTREDNRSRPGWPYVQISCALQVPGQDRCAVCGCYSHQHQLFRPEQAYRLCGLLPLQRKNAARMQFPQEYNTEMQPQYVPQVLHRVDPEPLVFRGHPVWGSEGVQGERQLQRN